MTVSAIAPPRPEERQEPERPAANAATPASPNGMAMRLRWVAVLYFAQGFPMGIVKDVWPPFFRVHGVSLAEVGMMSLLGLPWTWKPLWAPLVDRWGDRRVWIAACLAVMALVLAVHPLLDAANPGAIVWGVLLVLTLASATQDIAIDAHTIGFLKPGEEGAANGIRVSAYRAALIVSGGLLLILAGRVGWTATFLVAALAFAVLVPLVLRAPAAPLATTERRRFFRPFVEWLAKPGSIGALAFILLYKLGDQAISPMIKTFWVDRGLTLEEIGLVSTTIGVALTIAGALLGGFLTTRWGLVKGLVVMGIFQAASNGVYAIVAWVGSGRYGIYGASMFESFTQGLGTAAFLSLLMRLCDREHAGTQYALLSALFAVARDVAGAASGWATESLGYALFFAYTFALSFPAFVLLPWVKRRLDAARPPSGGTGDASPAHG